MIIFGFQIGVSLTLTLMIPYYALDFDTPLQDAFTYVDLGWASYIISIGGIISLTSW